MKNPLGNMGNILKQAQAMQAKMAKVQEQASTKTATGTAGGGRRRILSVSCGRRQSGGGQSGEGKIDSTHGHFR